MTHVTSRIHSLKQTLLQSTMVTTSSEQEPKIECFKSIGRDSESGPTPSPSHCKNSLYRDALGSLALSGRSRLVMTRTRLLLYFFTVRRTAFLFCVCAAALLIKCATRTSPVGIMKLLADEPSLQ